MAFSKTELTRVNVLKRIFESSSYGNLGIFIGAGFSKAVLNDARGDIALSWGDLLKKASEKMDVDYKKINKEGAGYPEIATAICKKYATKHGASYKASLSQLKQEIAALTSWYPDQAQRDKFSSYLEGISPSWIITTNYDMVIESLLIGRSIPLGPDDSLSSPAGIIPVFHLHGLRTSPESIIIAQEDYVSLFRPNEYRQIKLALTIKESTTLLLGYGLGDVNVLTALDWSRNVFEGENTNYPNDIIQVLRTADPAKEPYIDKNGVVILEVNDLAPFFDEYLLVKGRETKKRNRELKLLKQLAEQLADPDQDTIKNFIDDSAFRTEILQMLSRFSIHLISGFVSFLHKCIDETWHRSRPDRAFEGYNQNLIVILDILTAFPVERFPPALFQTAVYSLQRVGYFIGKGRGQSWAADDTWNARKGELSASMVKELASIAEQHRYEYVSRLVETIG